MPFSSTLISWRLLKRRVQNQLVRTALENPFKNVSYDNFDCQNIWLEETENLQNYPIICQTSILQNLTPTIVFSGNQSRNEHYSKITCPINGSWSFTIRCKHGEACWHILHWLCWQSRGGWLEKTKENFWTMQLVIIWLEVEKKLAIDVIYMSILLHFDLKIFIN